jgi:hypothetical protein
MRLGINKEDVGRVREMSAAELFFDPVLSGASASPEDYLALMEACGSRLEPRPVLAVKEFELR